MSTLNLGKGFTLIEAIVVVAVMAIVLAIAVPGGRAMVEAAERRSMVADLLGGFAVARNTAIQERIPVTVCPLDTDNRCVKDWRRPVTVFRDPARRRELTDIQQVVRVIPPPKSGRLTANTANRRYFGFRGTGMARSAIGNLVWCPDDGDVRRAIQLRMNMGGRLQHARDDDGDGVVEGADGKAIACS